LVSVSDNCINEDLEVMVLVSSTQNPSWNAEVTILKGVKIVASGKTNDAGIFSFNLSEAGDYELQVEKSGYSKKLDFSLIDCSQKETSEGETPPEEPVVITGEGEEGTEGTGSGEESAVGAGAFTGFAFLADPLVGAFVGLVVLAIILTVFLIMKKKKKEKK